MKLPQKFIDAIYHLGQLPGVGEKTAMRYVMHLTRWKEQEVQALGEALKDLCFLERCNECGMFADAELCATCSSPMRNSSNILCVIENVADYLAIEKSGEFRGLYHILGGVLNPMLGIGPDQLTIGKLLIRIKERSISEIILALPPTVEGDVTCSYLKEQISKDVTVNRIGLGVPMGGSLEYLDSMTINKALENKTLLM